MSPGSVFKSSQPEPLTVQVFLSALTVRLADVRNVLGSVLSQDYDIPLPSGGQPPMPGVETSLLSLDELVATLEAQAKALANRVGRL